MSRISEKKRNHLEYMRSRRPANWQNKKGAPTKAAAVQKYRADNPDATMYRCSKDTGISPNTIRKWWNKEV